MHKMKHKTTLTTLCSLLLMLAVGGCASQKNANDARRATTPSVATTAIVFDTMQAKSIANFKGGEGSINMKMFQDGPTRVMLCTMPPGTSVGYHVHENDMEVVYVMKGELTVTFDSSQHQTYTEGHVHYCPKSHGHRLANESKENLILYNVVSLQ